MLGTLVNTGAVVAGGLAGLALRRHLPRRLTQAVFQAIGLFTLVLGTGMSLRSEQPLCLLLALVAGTLLGRWAGIHRRIGQLSARLQRPGAGVDTPSDGAPGRRFNEGLVTAVMLFCVGSMAILGPVEDGLGQPPAILYTKSLMDGVSALVLAAGFGAAVMLAAVPMLVYQGAITLFAGWVAPLMDGAMIAELSAAGGVLLIGIGINILKIKELPVSDMLPALPLSVLLCALTGS